VSRESDIDCDIYTRIGKALSVHRRLRSVWRPKNTDRMLDVFSRCWRYIVGVSAKYHMSDD